MKNLSKKFAKNLYFAEIKFTSRNENEVEFNGILPALENSKSAEIQHDKELNLKIRVSKFLGFQPKFLINY